MTLPIDYEKEMLEQMKGFRARCSELNLMNSEIREIEAEYRPVYAEYEVLRAEYNAIKAKYDAKYAELQVIKTKGDGISQQITEIRSDLQARQATLLDTLISHLTRDGA